MKALIVYAHPSKKSYTYDVFQQLTTHLREEKIDYELSDLYSMNFQSDMSEQEYEREGFAKIALPIEEDVRKEQEKIKDSDCIIFIYPVWWSDCPAKLKGWFDRVYSVGYAYGQNNDNKHVVKMKTVAFGLVLCTAGHPNEFLRKIGIAQSMRNVMLDDRLGKRFVHKEMIILGGTLDKEKVKPFHSATIKGIGGEIKKYCATLK